MSVIGSTNEWADLIDPMVPQILELVIGTWDAMPSPGPNEAEDAITIALCRALQQNRTVRNLMFQIRTQVVELEPAAGTDLGRMDIVFIPFVPREDIYFCVESKRLNVVKDGTARAYASEYVTFGMARFVTGQYAKAVSHGGMIGYVLDGDLARAVANVEANIRARYTDLRMAPPGEFLPSSLLDDTRLRETHHNRSHESAVFRVHHVFMSGRA